MSALITTWITGIALTFIAPPSFAVQFTEGETRKVYGFNPEQIIEGANSKNAGESEKAFTEGLTECVKDLVKGRLNEIQYTEDLDDRELNREGHPEVLRGILNHHFVRRRFGKATVKTDEVFEKSEREDVGDYFFGTFESTLLNEENQKLYIWARFYAVKERYIDLTGVELGIGVGCRLNDLDPSDTELNYIEDRRIYPSHTYFVVKHISGDPVYCQSTHPFGETGCKVARGF